MTWNYRKIFKIFPSVDPIFILAQRKFDFLIFLIFRSAEVVKIY